MKRFVTTAASAAAKSAAFLGCPLSLVDCRSLIPLSKTARLASGMSVERSNLNFFFCILFHERGDLRGEGGLPALRTRVKNALAFCEYMEIMNRDPPAVWT